MNASRDLFDYFTLGKKAKDFIWKSIKEAEMQKNSSMPPWKRTGGGDIFPYSKPSKYQMNSNIKARVYTGLYGKPKPASSSDKLEK